MSCEDRVMCIAEKHCNVVNFALMSQVEYSVKRMTMRHHYVKAQSNTMIC